MTLNPRVILFAVAVLSISSMFIFSMPMSVCAESEYSEYVTPNGSVYEYGTYGSGSSSDPYYSVIYGFISDSDNVMIQSALEGYEVTCIAENAFSGCSKLAYVIIPERIESIGNGAFSGCASLTDVYFLGDIPSEMGSDAFPDNTIFHYVEGMSGWDSYEGHDLEMMLSGSVRSSDGSYSEYVIAGSDTIITSGTPNSSGSIIIPSSITVDSVIYNTTSLGAWAFYDRQDVKYVTIESGIGMICERAFYKCEALKSVTIPDTLTVVMDEAFRECCVLENIDLGNVEFIGFEAFRMCYMFSEIQIPETVKYIGEGAFRYCTSAEIITMDCDITEILPWTFDGCFAVISIEMPDSVTVVGSYAFHRCESLAYVEMSDNLVSVGEYAFYKCTMLESVTFERSIETIGNDAFYGCQSLTDVYFTGSMPVLGTDVFGKTADSFEIHLIEDNNDNTIWIIATVVVALLIIVALWFIIKHKY